MITDAAKRVASMVGKRVDLPLGRPSFRPEDRYKARDFDAKNFQHIDPSHSRGKIAFLDGGNLPLIQAPSFAVHFERVYFNCFQGKERAKLGIPSKLEFFVVTTSSGEGGKMGYESTFIPLDEEHAKYLPDDKDLVFDSYDESMREGKEQIQIPRIGDVARSFAEWGYAGFVCNELAEGDIFVRDGTLHAPYTNQTAYAEQTYDIARRKGVLFCGVSKTSHLYTTSGLPLVAAINRLARGNKVLAPWYYEDIVGITDPAHKADLNFARLNAAGDYVFRVEMLKGQEKSKVELMSALAANSADISFPGYPYGLLDADKNARVSEDELDALKMLLFSEMAKSKGFEGFRDLLLASDAHDWLNKMV